ncbi:hypothetical protein [Streptomyces sp. NPDC093060]|uniref:hypothetical protein n=1 Tax=Streptomyces sp. NPDC093060 TaxID=3366019 RepID=UPI00380DFD29
MAGLVHDIGHRLVPGDEAGHGSHAATAVEGLLGPGSRAWSPCTSRPSAISPPPTHTSRCPRRAPAPSAARAAP